MGYGKCTARMCAEWLYGSQRSCSVLVSEFSPGFLSLSLSRFEFHRNHSYTFSPRPARLSHVGTAARGANFLVGKL